MNHPNREDLVGFLYEEHTPETQAGLAKHVSDCAECRAQLDAWRAVRRELGSWKLPEPQRPAATAPSVRLVKWAAAAVILVGFGFGVARWTAPTASADTAGLRAAVAQELRQELRAELAKFSADQSARQQKYQAELTTALGRLEAQRLVDYARLRQDVETVAVRAEGELETTRQNLVRLASQGQ
jgi:hypothetical protein